MDIFSILTLLGGLALFLFGMNYMGDSLKKLSGSKLETILSKLTSNRFKGFLLGFGVTAVIQSSSAVMVMLVGFVNSGIMNLVQTTSVLMGANIGTTVTGWLLSTSGISGGNVLLRMLTPSAFTPVLAAVGLCLNMFSKSDAKKNIGSILIGFAVLMFGMEMMSDATSGLQDSKHFKDTLVMFSHPLTGILAGTLFTAVIQSSSASVGILQALSLTNAIPVSTALPIILGMNIGAALPPVLSAISGNTDAKRVAASCVYIKIIGVVVIAALFYGLDAVFDFGFMDANSSVFSIAFIHTLFNILSTAVLMPFCGAIERLSEMTFKSGAKEMDLFDSLDDRFLSYPAFAAGQTRELTADMAVLTRSSVGKALDLLKNYDESGRDKIINQERMIDTYEDRLSAYLAALTKQQLTVAESTEITTLTHIIGEVERVSDNARNLAETAKEMFSHSIELSENAATEVAVISSAINDIMGLAVKAIENKDKTAALRIEPLNRVISEISRMMKKNHITRLRKSECSTEFGFVFSSLLNYLGRIADHCSNIAVYLLQEEDNALFSPHEYKDRLSDDNVDYLQDIYDRYREKYTLAY